MAQFLLLFAGTLLLVASNHAFGLRHHPLDLSPLSWHTYPSGFHSLSPWRLVGDNGWFYDNMRQDNMWLEHPHHRIQSQRCSPRHDQVSCEQERTNKGIENESILRAQQEQQNREKQVQKQEARRRQLQEENRKRQLEAERQRVLQQYEQAEAQLRKKEEELRQYELAEEQLSRGGNNGESSHLEQQRQVRLDTHSAQTKNENQDDMLEARKSQHTDYHQNKAPEQPREKSYQQNGRNHRDARMQQSTGKSSNIGPQTLLEHNVPGYDPNDITIQVTNGRIQIQGRHICSCSENCIDREFARVFQTSPQIEGKLLRATLDAQSKLKVIGSYSNNGQMEGQTQVEVEGIGIPQTSQSHEDKIKCLQQKGGIKLSKLEKRVPKKVETYKYDYELESEGYHSDHIHDNDIDIEVEY